MNFVHFHMMKLLLLGMAVLPASDAFAASAVGRGAGTGAVPFSGWNLDVMSGIPDRQVPLTAALMSLAASAGGELTGRPTDTARAEMALDRLAARLSPALGDRRDPRRVVSAMNHVLFAEEGFSYDPAPGNPENYLLDRVIAARRGNCLGLTSLYLALAERLDIPLKGSYVPSHCFVRYEDGGTRLNIETGEKGAERTDERYSRDFRLSEGRPYLRTLGRKEMLAVYLKSLGAAYSRKGLEDRALVLYRQAMALYPGLPDSYYNAGVSYLKMGRLDDAIADYRRTLALDPDLAAARDNLGVALAKKGMFAEALAEARRAVDLAPWNAAARGNLATTSCACGLTEEGIRQFRKALSIDPTDARSRVGLAKAYLAAGAYRDAVEECDRALDLGCRVDPALVEALKPHRRSSRPASDLP